MVVVLAPKGATYRVREGKSPITNRPLHVAFMAMGEREIGLQVLFPKVASYFDQVRLCQESRIRLIDPVHIGKVSEIPQAYLASEDLLPMLFLRDDMNEPYFNLRDAGFKMLTTKEIN